MKVSKMIELLQQMPQDLEIYSCCDHGQAPEESCDPNVQVLIMDHNGFVDPESFMSYEDAIDSGYEEEQLVKIVML
ncbi:hypothetical protein BNCALIDO_00025 [Aeromonas phage vB_AdhM_TS9]|nr:hypothetical protein BNCALIDO_00025 [Aeromonas phage vB_AdhM_TS9]